MEENEASSPLVEEKVKVALEDDFVPELEQVAAVEGDAVLLDDFDDVDYDGQLHFEPEHALPVQALLDLTLVLKD